jgi:transcription initiation factor TFIIB
LLGEKRTQREVADTTNITEVTIRNRYQELVKKLGIEDEIEKKAKEE